MYRYHLDRSGHYTSVLGARERSQMLHRLIKMFGDQQADLLTTIVTLRR